MELVIVILSLLLLRVVKMNKLAVVILWSFLVSPSLANNLLEPLFSQKPSMALRLSPNGETYLIASMAKDNNKITAFRSATQSATNVVDLAKIFDENTLLRDIQWLDNKHVAAVLIDKAEVETSLYERNAQTRLIIVDISAPAKKPIIYEVTTPGELIEAAPGEDGIFYFSRKSHKSKVYRIEITKLLRVGQKRNKLTQVDGGQFIANNVVVEAKGYAVRWFFEASGKPVAVAFFTAEGTMELALFETDQQTSELVANTIKVWKKEELNEDEKDSSTSPLYLPIARITNSKSFYAIDYHESPALNLYLVDYETGTNKRIYSSPGLPIQDIIFSQNEEAIGVVVIEEGLYTEQYFDGQPSKSDAEKLEVVTNESLDANTKLIYSESHNQAGHYLLKIKQNEPVRVFNQYPEIPQTLPTQQVKGKVAVNNMDIPYLLTLPENTSPTVKAPLIIMPHGGPFNVFDSPYFDPMAQFFAANGIAVLRVNFRGSGGYGIGHRDAGKKQWGKNMLADLLAALKKVQQRSDIDASRTCSVGMSYGGYATLMLSLQAPELLKCAVSVAGVSDMNLFLKSPYISKSQLNWLEEYVGNSITDYDDLIAISPLYKIRHLQIPLLLIHGAKDERVSVEHGYRVKLLLEQAQTPFTWELFEEADHHFAEDDQRVQLFSSILNFVNQHLKHK